MGTGPVYRVEVLFRYGKDGRLYYLRTLLSAKQPTSRMFGLSVDDKGKPVPPPNPWYAQASAEQVNVSSKGVPPPLAETTRLYGASVHPNYVSRAGELVIRESDLATSMSLPTKPDTRVLGFRNGIFVVELLSAKQLANENPLRQDPEHFWQRTKELMALLLTTHRAKLTKDERSLAHAIDITRDSKLLDEAHRQLNGWIDKPTKEVGDCDRLASAVLRNGDERDIALAARLLQKHPRLVWYFLGDTIRLAQRSDGARVMPLWKPLIQHGEPGDQGNFVRLVRKLTPMVPAPIAGDNAVIAMVRTFELRARDFHLTMAQDVLLAKGEEFKLTLEEKELCQLAQRYPPIAKFFFATEADRNRGQEAALKWMAGHRAR
ncbi:MAG: hypothetical protein EXR98_12255 [Gemmataceae bacterium]|nr:hypothetical protein [Gemmataceae bacterium]